MNVKKLLLIIIWFLPLFTTGAIPHADSSVLATGKWYKLAVTHTGIYQISYNDLVDMGIDPASVEVSKIRIFGNGTGMLSEINSSPRIDDLRELAIEVGDGGDNHFDQGDYILFYGESADKWAFDRLTRFYSHQRNLYSDSTFYYLNVDQVPGRRVKMFPVPSEPATYSSDTFDDFLLHELDSLNLIRSGKEWYGETFDNILSERTYPFYFPEIDTSGPLKLRWSVAGYAPVPSYFYILRQGSAVDSLKIDSTLPQEFTRAGRSGLKLTTIHHPEADQTVTVKYKLPTANSRGWLNFLELSCRRHLYWHGPQLSFRDVNSTSAGRITEFIMNAATAGIRVWDVSNRSSIGEMVTTLAGSQLKYKRTTDTLREFIAFDGTAFLKAHYDGQVANQNLHAVQPATLVIVANPKFLNEAETLGNFHRDHNNLSVQIVTTEQVFNEFSSGQPDPTAIRDFLKMLYDRGNETTRPRYLLLFGDGSYDPKNRIPGNNNLVPTFQSVESLSSTATYVTDDYFGIMADNSGQEANGTIDLGIGRFPVSTNAEAQALIEKIIHYSSQGSPVCSDYRNIITFVADDENHNLHLQQAEELCAIVASKYPLFNVNKVYFDAYKMVEIPGGTRFPDANTALNKVVNDGSLIVNYTGHGGETGWSVEQVLTTSDILAWKNKDKLPVFITATCEFSRFDNPERFTAGEMLILQPDGGAIALYSTTRLAFAGSNILLNNSFFQHLMDKNTDGGYLKMGDLIRLSKNDNANNAQLRNFALLGDPAQNIAFAPLNVRTLTINQKNAQYPDTAKGLTTVTVTGQVEDPSGQKVSSFSGVMNCKIYDKPVTNTTLGNRPGPEGSYPESFKIQNSLLFKGDVPVEAGTFQFSFVMPRSIQLQYGSGKISYYGYSNDNQAAGYSDKLIIGGRDVSVDPVNQGPEIQLYLDDRSFVNGGQTASAAILIVDLADTNGINSLGLGIGHEIEAVLDNNNAKALVLNDYYSPMLNSYTRGSIAYPLDGLTPGKHTLSLKAWDMFDNSSRVEITFYVAGTSDLKVKNVMNVPNPLVDHTSFVFEPQIYQSGGLNVQISIYNLNGILVKTINQSYSEPLAGSPSIAWNGTDSNGKPLKAGIYPYKIVFKAGNGSSSATSQKLIIVR